MFFFILAFFFVNLKKSKKGYIWLFYKEANQDSLWLEEGVWDINIPLVLLVHVETSFVVSVSFTPQDEITTMQSYLLTTSLGAIGLL